VQDQQTESGSERRAPSSVSERAAASSPAGRARARLGAIAGLWLGSKYMLSHLSSHEQ